MQNDENNGTVHSSGNPDSLLSNYHIDLEDLLESLDVYQNNCLQENPSESLSMQESDILTEERNEESISLTVDNHSVNSFSLVNEDKSNDKPQGGEKYLCGGIEPESNLICNNNIINLESNINTNSTQSDPDMVELGNYYIPDTVFETINEPTILMDDFCNEIDITTTEDTDIEEIDNQVRTLN